MEKLGKLFGKERVLQNPPNSPDLSVLDYHTWAYIDKKAQQVSPETTPDLKKCVVAACKSLDMDELKRAIESWPKRLQKCIAAEGARFEHSL